MKKLLAIVLSIAMLCSTVACGGSSSPSTTIDTLFEGIKNWELKKVQSCLLNPGDASEIDDYESTPMSKTFLKYWKEWSSKLQYKINDTKINGDNATVSVNCKYTDASAVIKAVIGTYLLKALGQAFSDASDDNMDALIEECFKEVSKTTDTETAEMTLSFNMVKSDGKWLIKEMPEDVFQVMTSNSISALSNMFGNSSSTETKAAIAETSTEQATTEPPTTEPPTTEAPTTTAAPVSEIGYWILTYYKDDSSLLIASQIRQYEKQTGFKAFIVFEKDHTGYMNLFGDEQEFTWRNGDISGASYTFNENELIINDETTTLKFKRSNETPPKKGELVNSASATPQIEEQVIFDAKGIKITAKSIDYDERYGPAVKLLIENNSGKDLTFQARNCSINGFMMDPMMSVDVANGKKANDTMLFSDSDLEKAGMEKIAEIQFQLYAFDTDSWKDYAESDTISLITSAFDTYSPTYTFDGKILHDANNIKILCTGLSDGYMGPEIEVYIENNTNRNITVQVKSCAINGFMVDPIFSSDIVTGKRIIDDISFLESDLKKNGLSFSDISEVELSFRIFDADSWKDIANTQPVTVKFR